MQNIRWEYYPLVGGHAEMRAFVTSLARRKSAKTVDAYARSLEDLAEWFKGADPGRILEAGPDDLDEYIDGLHERPPRRRGWKANIRRMSGSKLAPATIRLRTVAARRFYDYVIWRRLRKDTLNPVPRGQQASTARHAAPGPVRNHKQLPWIPPDDVWERFVTHVLVHESLRNQVMIILAYEGALRRQELVGLCNDDIDFENRLLKIRSDLSKTGLERYVTFGAATTLLIKRYLTRERAPIIETYGGEVNGPLFLSTSYRNPGVPLKVEAFNDIIERLRSELDMPLLRTHTFRHFRLTVLKIHGMDLQDIALYAGHASIDSTRIYLHTAPSLLAKRVATASAASDARMKRWIEEAADGE